MKKTILAIVFALFSVQTVSALTINMDVSPSFSQGEQIYFNYTIFSDTNQQAIFIPSVFCPKLTVALIQQKRIDLIANVPYSDFYYDKVIDSSAEQQICTATIAVVYPIRQTVSKKFTIQTTPSFSFELKTCKDQPCAEKTKVFVQGESIYLDYSSSVSSPSITAVLTYPDGTSKQVTLPASFKANQIGTYTLDVTASKQGYKTQSMKEQFGVIEGEPDIKTASACNSNGRCDAGENEQNCPQDCKKAEKPTGMNIPLYLFPALAVFIAILIVIMIFLIKRNL